MPALDQKGLEEAIGYRFQKPETLRTALTHSSYANEQTGKRAGCNERLEFLGDSVLSLIVCDYLYRTYPGHLEGQLTILRKNAVCQAALADYGMQIGLGNYVLLGRGEEKDGREKPKILEDAFESLLGAMYLDCGGLARVAEFLLPFVKRKLAETAEPEDAKTMLQRFVQQTPGEELHYAVVGETGPDNAKIFTVKVYINSNDFGTGRGSSKKEAEQNAAHEALKHYIPSGRLSD